MDAAIRLLDPDLGLLAPYEAALEAGWSPSTTRDVTAEQLQAIRADPAAFIARLQEIVGLQEREGRSIALGDGRLLPRLPGPVFWIWDDTFCGQINLRYQPGTLDLPPHVSGHVGYAVVPWKRRLGIASAALRLLRPIAAARGLPRVLVTCDEGNLASRRVVEKAGGAMAGSAPAGHGHGHAAKLLFWLPTA